MEYAIVFEKEGYSNKDIFTRMEIHKGLLYANFQLLLATIDFPLYIKFRACLIEEIVI